MTRKPAVTSVYFSKFLPPEDTWHETRARHKFPTWNRLFITTLIHTDRHRRAKIFQQKANWVGGGRGHQPNLPLRLVTNNPMNRNEPSAVSTNLKLIRPNLAAGPVDTDWTRFEACPPPLHWGSHTKRVERPFQGGHCRCKTTSSSALNGRKLSINGLRGRLGYTPKKIVDFWNVGNLVDWL